jgi:hypothetical protein
VSTRITTTNQQLQRKRLPFDQLKYAVSNNLPCFLVEYNPSTPARNLPSAITSSKMIGEYLRKQNVPVGNFTLVGWTGKRLKLGVNNKEDYISLFTTDKWPTSVDKITIIICKPKFISDSFALVVRYVPQNTEIDFVVKETHKCSEQPKCAQCGDNQHSQDSQCDVIIDSTEPI